MICLVSKTGGFSSTREVVEGTAVAVVSLVESQDNDLAARDFDRLRAAVVCSPGSSALVDAEFYSKV